MADDYREQAEAQLAAREAKMGAVTNRERWLAAVELRLRNTAPRPARTPAVDTRPDCARCDGNGWVETVPEGSYQMVTRCPDCDHGRVSLRAAPDAPCSPDVARAHVSEIRASLLRMRAKQSVRDL